MKLVEKIRKKELAIENDGSVKDLRKVLNFVFPKNGGVANGSRKYYFALVGYLNEWEPSDKTDLPTVSVKEVLAEIESENWQPKWGEMVECSDDGVQWFPYCFVAKHPIKNGFIVSYKNGFVSIFNKVRQITMPEMTISEAEQKFNIKIKLLGN